MVTASETAPSKALTATPIKITVPRDAPHRLAPTLMSMAARKAPTKENSESLQPPIIPHAEQRVTASPAPAFTPISPGDASRLASTPCITAPETESAAPHSRLAKTLGKRTYHKILASEVSFGPPNKADISSEKLNSVAPSKMPRRKESNTKRTDRRYIHPILR